MQTAHDFSEAALWWKIFLLFHNRVWMLSVIEYKGHHFWQPIRSCYGEERNTDPALIYLRQARNAGEHGIAPAPVKVEPSLGIGGTGFIKEMRIESGRVTHFEKTPGITATYSPSGIMCQPVTNYGVTYTPPEPRLASSLAGIGLRFYHRLFADIEAAEKKGAAESPST